MAKDELLDEPLFREIEEDLRRDRMHVLWKRYRVLLIAAVAGILLAVAGSQVWLHFKHEAIAKASVRFADAQALEQTDRDGALAAFQTLAAEGPRGYALLARLQAAALFAKKGDHAGAITAYKQIEKDAPEPTYRDLATLLKVMVSLQAPADEIDEEDVAAQLGRLATDSSPWRYSARELQAQMAFATGNKAEAERLVNILIADPTTPAGVRNRARMLLTQTGQS